MDLPKAKVVIIVMLIAFNAFLLFNNWTSYKGQGIQEETIKNTIAILAGRGVTLECGIPRTSKAVYRLEFGSGRLDRQEIAGKLFGQELLSSELSGEPQIAAVLADSDGAASEEERLDDTHTEDSRAAGFEYDGKKLEFLSGTRFVFTDDEPDYAVNTGDDDEVIMIAMKYLKEKKLLNGKYVFDELKREPEGKVMVTFIQEYEGLPVYDNYCTVTATGKGITGLEYGKLQIKGFAPGRVQDMASAYQVLLANYTEGNGEVITDIDIGYKYSEEEFTQDMQSLELLPVWRVRIKDAPEPDYLSTIESEQ